MAPWQALRVDWQLVLNFVRTLVWPVVIVAVVAWLKGPIRERFGAVEKVSAMGVEVEMAARAVEQEAEELSKSLTDSDSSSEEPVSKEPENGAERPGRPAQVVTPDVIQPVLTETQRRAIGELVQQAAEWGSLRAGAGLSVQGATLRWENGVPRLVTPSTTSARTTTRGRQFSVGTVGSVDEAAVSEVVRRLEGRVAELDHERRRLRHILAADPGAVRAAEEQYRDAVDRLRLLDPRSAYVD
jgi:hypothetical protein